MPALELQDPSPRNLRVKLPVESRMPKDISRHDSLMLDIFSYLSSLFFGTLHSDGGIFPFLLCLYVLLFSQPNTHAKPKSICRGSGHHERIRHFMSNNHRHLLSTYCMPETLLGIQNGLSSISDFWAKTEMVHCLVLQSNRLCTWAPSSNGSHGDHAKPLSLRH